MHLKVRASDIFTQTDVQEMNGTIGRQGCGLQKPIKFLCKDRKGVNR